MYIGLTEKKIEKSSCNGIGGSVMWWDMNNQYTDEELALMEFAIDFLNSNLDEDMIEDYGDWITEEKLEALSRKMNNLNEEANSLK